MKASAAAEAELASLKAEIAALKAEVVASKNHDAEALASQGEVLRAFEERLFLSVKFSGSANELTSILSIPVAAEIIDDIAADYPGLDKDKYGYEVLPREALLRAYAKILTEGMAALPVLNCLTASSTVLTASDIRACSVDKDEVIEGVIASLGTEVDQPVTDEPADTGAKPINSEAEQTVSRTQQEGPRRENEAPGGVS